MSDSSEHEARTAWTLGWVVAALVSLPGVAFAGGGGCSGNGCIESGSCEPQISGPGLSVPARIDVPAAFAVQVALDSYSEMGELRVLSPSVQESDWLMVEAQGTMGQLGNAVVTLDPDQRSFYRMVSQQLGGEPFFPARAECHLFWRFEVTDPATGEALVMHSSEAVYAAAGIGSYPPRPGTTFRLQNDVVLTSENQAMRCDFPAGSGVVAYSGEAMNPPVVINELDAVDGEGGGAAFIELYDGGVGDRALDGLTVVLFDGASGQAYAQPISLAGHRSRDDGLFLIAGPGVEGVDLAVELPLRGESAAVALYYSRTTELAVGFQATPNELVDAVVLGPLPPRSPLRRLLRPGMPLLTELAEGNAELHSLQRSPDGGWRRDTRSFEAALPTPGQPNLAALHPDVPPRRAGLWLLAPFAIGLVWLWRTRG